MKHTNSPPPSRENASLSDLIRKPYWLRRPMAHEGKQEQVKEQLNSVHTVCTEAKCPNRGECFAHGTATFLVMGAVCTRRCIFCSVGKGVVKPLDWGEIDRVVEAAVSMQLHHLVITSVTRDDLPDGGASFFAKLVNVARERINDITIELLIPDMQGDHAALSAVFASRPDVLNHNVETVPSLYHTVRPQADYRQSLSVLRSASEAELLTKSGMMVGLGESKKDVFSVMDDLAGAGCSIVTIGQYLQPTPEQTPVVRYVTPEEFKEYRDYGEKKDLHVVAGPFVRSSYNALKIMKEYNGNLRRT
jgi:lipoyl synthase